MIQSNQYAIDGVPVRVSETAQVNRQVFLHAASGSLYIGPADVTASTGLLLDKAAGVVMIQIDPNDELWLISGGGTHTVTVLEVFI